MSNKGKSTARPAEIEHFSALAASWWQPDGPFQPLHRLNTVRTDYVTRAAAIHFGRDAEDEKPLQGLRVIDIGCGGGLLAEPLALLGAFVTGIDASGEAIDVARAHAAESGLKIEYRIGGPEALASSVARYDLVVAMEIVEHVADVGEFMTASAQLAKPGGLLAFSTLNRTLRSMALGKVAAEYVLGWVPPGTHSWRQFVKPSELAAALRGAGCDLTDVQGVVFNPLRQRFERQNDVSVNYLALAKKRG